MLAVTIRILYSQMFQANAFEHEIVIPHQK